MNVLFVNHTAQVSGGERSLLAMLRGVSPTVNAIVACPDGPLVQHLEGLGIQHATIPGTDGSLRLHPVRTPLALLEMTRAAAAVVRLARRHSATVIHANSIRAGLISTGARHLGGPPTLVHLRDRLPKGRLSSLTLRTIGHADAVIANSVYTAESLREAGVSRKAMVLGNPVELARFDPHQVDRHEARATLAIADEDFVATVLAQITPWKGQEEAIRAVALVRRHHPCVKLLLVGSAKFVSRSTRYDNIAYLERLRSLVTELGLRDHVRFVGEREDVPAVLRATDTLLVPSWEEPFGRSIVEAMAMGVPVVATTVGGPPEIITDGHDGLLRPPRRPEAWASALMALIERSDWREEIAATGRRRAQAFSLTDHADALVELYRVLADQRGRTATRAPEQPVAPLTSGI